MGRPAGTGHSDYHPSACTCVSCVARRSGHKPGRKVWRGRDVTPEKPRDVYERGRPLHDVRGWNRLSPLRRHLLSTLSFLVTLSVGAVLAVLIVHPLLPDNAQAKIMQVQQKVAELAPWL